MDINELSSKIIGAAIEIHKTLGSGLLDFIARFAQDEEIADGKQQKNQFRLCVLCDARGRLAKDGW